MTARPLPATGRAAAEAELLAQLGLPPSASPEDVDERHREVSEYLADAPNHIRTWAHAQAAALDAAYLHLTDQVGLPGSALRSPARPPTVVPGGPATPPARRGLRPAAPPPQGAPEDDAIDEDAEEDFDALLASVTPSMHRESRPDPSRRARRSPAAPAPASTAGGVFLPWRRLAAGLAGVAILVAVGLAMYNLGGGGAPGGTATDPQPSTGAPLVDEAKIADLMVKIQANPNDRESLMALADEFYASQQFQVAATWLDKVLAIDPKDVQALLARGAVSFNLGETQAAEAAWMTVLEIEPGNIEAHYDLGFLYLNQTPPDMVGVEREWTQVVELGPGTQLAQTVQAHLDSLAASSMLPAPSASPVATQAPASEAPASAAPSPDASTQP